MSTAVSAEQAISPVINNMAVADGIRRSGRSKKAPVKYDDEYIEPPAAAAQPKVAMRPSRPKRKAAEPAMEHNEPEDVQVLLEQVLARMDDNERKEYRGWVELESEPAFFNAMLQDLDAKAFKVHEVFMLDEMTLDTLPKPVYGLIFLYQWSGGDESNVARQQCPESLWFGNQTTANACATVALMNIIMNAEGVELGPELRQFKDSTTSLQPPHRGHALDKNDFVRAIHNSVARRTDLLSEDLLLDNKSESASKRRKPSGTTSSRSKKQPARRRNSNGDETFHYIAFVPVAGQVWELDGLEEQPLCLGSNEAEIPESWLASATEAIQARMQRHGDEFLAYNLLAVCHSPLTEISDKLALNLANADLLGKKLTEKDLPGPNTRSTSLAAISSDHLARFNLTHDKVADFPPLSSLVEKINKPDFHATAGQKLAEDLKNEQRKLENEYMAEMGTIDDAVEMIRARQRDFTPAVYQWLRILAEKGVLRDFIQELSL